MHWQPCFITFNAHYFNKILYNVVNMVGCGNEVMGGGGCWMVGERELNGRMVELAD